MRESVLDQIPGIGDVRKKKLLSKFKSVSASERASVAELEQVLPQKQAQCVYDFFHNRQEEQP